MSEDFSGCKNFRNMQKFTTCWHCSSSLQLFVSYNPPFDAPEIKFSNLLSHSINGH